MLEAVLVASAAFPIAAPPFPIAAPPPAVVAPAPAVPRSFVDAAGCTWTEAVAGSGVYARTICPAGVRR
jgi:hypothetical protein